jgi:DNA-binding response OmpR family regulator
MASIVVAGSNAALLEGVVQALAAAGYTVRAAHTLAEAVALAGDEPPLVAVLERELLSGRGASALALAPGGATLLYHAAESDRPALPHRVQRATLADVTLPLERARLLALVQSVVERQQATGRERRRPPAPRDQPPGS